MRTTSRRLFLKRTASVGAVSGLPTLLGLDRLRPVSAADTILPADSVRFSSDIEPLVRLLEETPRNRVIEEFATRVRDGRVSYRQVLAALLLAGVRNIQPRPSVGFKFHAVLVINSAHLASLSSPDSDRWLPIFWAIDNFKSSQARDVDENDWTMSAVDESAVPPAHQAPERLRQALRDWDESAADVATVALCRGHSAGTAFDLLAEFAARDFRSIGHKAIYLANSFRTLQSIGWQYAEPVLRSLVYAMLNHSGEPNPATSDLAADRDGRTNRERLKEIRADWVGGKIDSAATSELLQSLRSGSSDEASRLVTQQLNQGISAQSVYDGLFAAAAELTMRQPAIVPLHAMTTTNAIHHSFRTCRDDATRRYLLLQNASFLSRFRQAAQERGDLADLQIDTLSVASDSEAIELPEVFEQLGHDKPQAAAAMLGYLQSGRSASDAITHARRLIFLKGRDSHDYKYSSAVLEDFRSITPPWRDRYLSAALFKMRSATEPTTPLVDRIRDALGTSV